ncbi:MAG: hypothetical protein JXR94_21190, partial [Candidatus Hydrogenedentes bacterium]|nr:hypothetical protein [Candidatus Hydrogenedentota bacterium]
MRLTAFAAAACASLAAHAAEDFLAGERAQEWDAISQHMAEFRGNEAAQARLRREALRDAALINDADRDPLDVVLRRTRALLDDIETMDGAPDLSRVRTRLDTLSRQSAGLHADAPERRQAFDEACALRRRIAFSNPLLDFSRILFLKHDRARYQHMVDQYFGFHALPTGGVYVLDEPFGEHPDMHDVLAGSTVANGRLKGKSLEGGSFISLDLSFDASTMLFAWTEAEVPVEPTDRTPMEHLWTPGSTYHVFKAGVDGSGLTQLTDGRWNDFDPCW